MPSDKETKPVEKPKAVEAPSPDEKPKPKKRGPKPKIDQYYVNPQVLKIVFLILLTLLRRLHMV